MDILHGQIVSDWPGGTHRYFDPGVQTVGDPPAFPTSTPGFTGDIPSVNTLDQNQLNLMEVFQYLRQGRGVPQSSIDALNAAYGNGFDAVSALGIDPSRIIANGSPVEAYDAYQVTPDFARHQTDGFDLPGENATQADWQNAATNWSDFSRNATGTTLDAVNATERAVNTDFARSMGSQLGQSLQGVDNQPFLNDLSWAARYGMGTAPEYDPAKLVDYRAPEATTQGVTDFLNGGGVLPQVDYGTPFSPQTQQTPQAPQQQQPAPTTGTGFGNGFGGLDQSAQQNLDTWGQMAYNGASAANNGFQSGYPTNVSPIYNPNPNGATPRNGFGGPLGNNNPWAPTF